MEALLWRLKPLNLATLTHHTLMRSKGLQWNSISLRASNRTSRWVHWATLHSCYIYFLNSFHPIAVFLTLSRFHIHLHRLYCARFKMKSQFLSIRTCVYLLQTIYKMLPSLLNTCCKYYRVGRYSDYWHRSLDRHAEIAHIFSISAQVSFPTNEPVI